MSDAQPWPLKEATALAESLSGRPDDGPVLFETGYGPSGLPHIGTFAEVARTTFIRRAFQQVSDRPTKLIAFSDDMDGLRKVPLNIPNPEAVEPHLGKPLSSIPDPFGVDASYSAHMNRRLREFLDAFGFAYTFRSSTDVYTSGGFNEGLRVLLQRVDAVLDVILPTLRPEKRAGWSPFMVTCPDCGRNLTTSVTAYHPADDAIAIRCDSARWPSGTGCGFEGVVNILDGRAKAGWKVDWALRWWTFGVHYEMYGKDLIESAALSKRIVEVMGGTPPAGLFYEMFLDEDGRKISKSVGKGISVDGWQAYAPVESLLAFLYQNPRKAKRLHYDVIPMFADQYLKQLNDWTGEDDAARRWNPSWFYFDGDRPTWDTSVNYSLVRNLVVCLGDVEPDVVLDYLKRYDPSVDAPQHVDLARDLIRGAIAYDRDWEADKRVKEAPAAELHPAISALADAVAAYEGEDAEAVQALVFDVARAHEAEPRVLFRAIYRGLIGQDRGPRLGSFLLALGQAESAKALRGLLRG
jgi:lysyl-tRNA synthetase class 1